MLNPGRNIGQKNIAMKKVKLSSLELIKLTNEDKLISVRGTGIKLAERMDVLRKGYFQVTSLAPGVEHQLTTSSVGLLEVYVNTTGAIGLFLIGSQPITVVLIKSSGTTSFGTSDNAAEDVLLYRKETNGPIFLKNQRAAPASMTLNFY